MASATIEVVHTHDAAGQPASSSQTFELESEKVGQTMPDVVEKWIRPYRPSRTSESCVYTFDSPEHGTGTITVKILGAAYRERMDEKVYLLDIERAIGQVQPCRLPDPMRQMYGIQLQLRSPYLQIIYGGVVAYVGVVGFRAFWVAEEVYFRVGIPILCVIGIGVSIWFMLYPAIRRWGWWHRARAEVKRRGDKMPFGLRMFS